MKTQLNSLQQIRCRYSMSHREKPDSYPDLYRRLCVRLQDYYLQRAITDNGHNDTSVPIGAAGGHSGGGEIPMMMARNRQSDCRA